MVTEKAWAAPPAFVGEIRRERGVNSS